MSSFLSAVGLATINTAAAVAAAKQIPKVTKYVPFLKTVKGSTLSMGVFVTLTTIETAVLINQKKNLNELNDMLEDEADDLLYKIYELSE